MDSMKLYRKRIIPPECILLKDDIIVHTDSDVIVTKWNTLKPKPNFHHGCSCYFLNLGLKVSKFYKEDDTLLYWYCDIVDFSFDEAENALTVTDLLADVILYPDGEVQVLDLDELADALDKKLVSPEMISTCLRRLHRLLSLIHRDKFEHLQSVLNHLGL